MVNNHRNVDLLYAIWVEADYFLSRFSFSDIQVKLRVYNEMFFHLLVEKYALVQSTFFQYVQSIMHRKGIEILCDAIQAGVYTTRKRTDSCER
jgi:hypothetical protein